MHPEITAQARQTYVMEVPTLVGIQSAFEYVYAVINCLLVIRHIQHRDS